VYSIVLCFFCVLSELHAKIIHVIGCDLLLGARFGHMTLELVFVCSADDKSFVVISPLANHSERRLPILLETNSLRFDTGHMFEYRPNPTFHGIEPLTHLLVYVYSSCDVNVNKQINVDHRHGTSVVTAVR